nr:DEAD/DEAH box helicase [Methylorubrum zatmanii]
MPENHGLPEVILDSNLIHRDELGEIQLTDIQFEALEAGVARGNNILAVAPTSSGKTDVGLYAAGAWLVSGLDDGAKVVFLTSHRALARQKFYELIENFAPLLMLGSDELVLATGDDALDSNGDPVPDALAVPVIVTTYEKYLNMLSGAGFEAGRSKVCCICDEIQLIGDQNRGTSAEILLTLLKGRFGQIVGLSAVLESGYAGLLSSWLGTNLIRTVDREIPLKYELRTARATMITDTSSQKQPEILKPRSINTIDTLRDILTDGSDSEPIAVFCMTKKQVFDLAEDWSAEAARLGARVDETLPLFSELTSSAEELVRYLPHRFAYHTADLNEDERVAVETKLDDNNLRVVFATTTLASGLNYSFKTVIIHSWMRYNQLEKIWAPIPSAEFHNMAGRAGRLSRVDKAGRVIYFAGDSKELRAAPRYLSWWELEVPPPRIQPTSFSQLGLQLLASGVATSEVTLFEFLQSTFSAQREMERNAQQPELWGDAIRQAISDLKKWRFISQ